MIDIQSVTDGISQRAKSGRQYTSLILVDPLHKVTEASYHNLMLLEQISDELIIQQNIVQVHLHLRQSTFLPVTLPNVDRF